jgi:redox-sensitive bicupin YhaK (pirin superfamily)
MPLDSPHLEVGQSHEAHVGHFTVRRSLPRRGRRTVGAWCFADHFGPAAVTPRQGMDVGPHPHCGLQTVTWLTSGEVLHRDSLGTEHLIRPGQLNLMSAGRGVAHSEEATGRYEGRLEGLQLWVAQPEATRSGPPAFEHHGGLPRLDVPGGQATVLVGELAGVTSPARHDSDQLGAELVLTEAAELALRPDFEHAVIVMEDEVLVGDVVVREGEIAYLAPGPDTLAVVARGRARVMLLGGVPFPEEILMWWNFVARGRGELESARSSWEQPDGRFGEVASLLARVGAPEPYWRR